MILDFAVAVADKVSSINSGTQDKDLAKRSKIQNLKSKI